MGSLLRSSVSDKAKEYRVQVETLDSFFKEEQKENVIWIDVEGAASSVISGGNSFLKKTLAIYMELEKAEFWVGQKLDSQIYRQLASFGLYPVARDIFRDEWQYNVLLLHETVLKKQIIQEVLLDYFKKVY